MKHAMVSGWPDYAVARSAEGARGPSSRVQELYQKSRRGRRNQKCYRHLFFPSEQPGQGAPVELAHTAFDIHPRRISLGPAAGRAALTDNNKLRI